MNDSSDKDYIQITSAPEKFELTKYFGPFFGHFVLPKDVVSALLKMTDVLLKDSTSESWGKNLAGVINDEIYVFKEDMIKFGVDNILENCVKSYIINAAKMHHLHDDSYLYSSMINNAWIVSQYENEYNPVHGHTRCDISAVLYLKTPNVKGRRNIKGKETDNDSNITFIYNASSVRGMDILDRGMLSFQPNVGSLYIFPSYLLHTVYPFIGGEERRSLAFNAVYRVTKDKEIIYGSDLNFNDIYYLKKR